VPAHLIKIKYITIRVEKVASPNTALQLVQWLPVMQHHLVSIVHGGHIV